MVSFSVAVFTLEGLQQIKIQVAESQVPESLTGGEEVLIDNLFINVWEISGAKVVSYNADAVRRPSTAASRVGSSATSSESDTRKPSRGENG